MVQGLSSAKGVLSLLQGKDSVMVGFALRRLSDLMDTFWHEISSHLPFMEELVVSDELPTETRRLAALVVSQVYFHLGEYDASVKYALTAGNAFDGRSRSLFTDSILSRCIDKYVSYQEAIAAATAQSMQIGVAAAKSPQSPRDAAAMPELDPGLEELFVSLTQSWVLQNETMNDVKEMIGFTIRARRLDFLEKVLKQSLTKTHSAESLNFCFHVANVLLQDIVFRRKVLRLLAELYAEGLVSVDYYSLAQCLLFLGDVPASANLIEGLLKADNRLVAYQLAFDLFEYGNQQYLAALVQELSQRFGLPPAGSSAGGAEETTESPEKKVVSVLTGEVTTNFYIKFLYARCAVDEHVLLYVKNTTYTSRSITNSAMVLANAMSYCGTSMNGILRNESHWRIKAEHWAKFAAVASVGAIHRGHVEKAMTVLEPFLPKEGGTVEPLPYEAAGSLYALGLIHAPLGVSRDREVVDYLKKQLKYFAANEKMVHGGSLGVGLTAMSSQDEDLYDTLATCIAGTNAVGGEAAAVATGMVMLGSGNETVLYTLKNIAQEDNQKERVIRGACIGMALVHLGREDEALTLARELLDSTDLWMRLGGCYLLGLAYAGTENTLVLEMLLSVTVKDTADDVRRGAATMIGFLTFKDPKLCLSLIRILVDSYNPHVRYGVTMALAAAAASTGDSEVIDVLWEMKEDLVDYVRQGAHIALAVVMAQVTEKECPRVGEFRKMLAAKIVNRREDLCSKFGYIVATGILDAGGRNCILSMHKDRHRLDKAVVGFFMFTQYWYWYPYMLMLTLAMQPTCVIALNDQLEMPEYTFKSNAPPSRFAPPKSVLQEKKSKASEVQAVVLSTTHKEEELRGRKQAGAAAGASASEVDKAAKKKGEEEPAKEEEEPEATFEILHNPARVTAHQFAVITHDVDERYVPLKPKPMGVCLLKDTKPEMGPAKMVQPVVEGSKEDAPVPKPFSYP